MSKFSNLSGLIDFTGRAIEACDAQRFLKLCKGAMGDAYREWKRANLIGRVERDTPEWRRMMGATAPAYERLEKAKRAERNSLRHLATAVRRYREGGEA